jgi:hypothetical protein
MIILLGNNPNSIGLIIANVILLGVGVMPLIVATIGLLRIMYETPLHHFHAPIH